MGGRKQIPLVKTNSCSVKEDLNQEKEEASPSEVESEDSKAQKPYRWAERDLRA